MNLDLDKFEAMERRERALAAEVDQLREQVTDRRRAVYMQRELLRRAIGIHGLRQRRNSAELVAQFVSDPHGVLEMLREQDHPAVTAAANLIDMNAALARSENALADAERRLNSFRPAYFKARDFIRQSGVALI